MSQLPTRKVGGQGWEKSGHRFLSSDYTLLWKRTQVAGDNMDVFKWINFSCSSLKSTWREHKLPVHYNKDMDVTFLLTVVIKNKSVKHSEQYCWQCCLTIILFSIKIDSYCDVTGESTFWSLHASYGCSDARLLGFFSCNFLYLDKHMEWLFISQHYLAWLAKYKTPIGFSSLC